MDRRLIQVAKELNISLTTIVAFLTNEGFSIVNNPIATLSGEMYDIVIKKFTVDHTQKIKADKIKIFGQTKKYLGVLTNVRERKYDNTIYKSSNNSDTFFTSGIKCPEFQNIITFHSNYGLRNRKEINNIAENRFVFFEMKEMDNKQVATNSYIANAEQEIEENLFQYDSNYINFILNYSSEDFINKLLQKLKSKENTTKSQEIIEKIRLIKNETQIKSEHIKEVSKKVENEKINNHYSKSFLESIFQANTLEYNQNLFKILVEGLKSIDNNDVFQQAKFLLKFNNKNPHTDFNNLSSTFYQKSTNDYKFNLWFEGLVEFCDTDILKDKFFKADETLKVEIIKRCKGSENGFLVLNNQVKNSNEIEEVYFRDSGICNKLLEELNKAQKTILVAVAWFTNSDLFSMLCMKLNQGVKVELIINNDYINNWEFGLPFQSFVDLKGKLYLSDYPNMMHHKFCLIDNEILFNGSYNWTYYAEMRNEENIMLFKGKPNLMKEFKNEFRKLKSKLGEPITQVTRFDSSHIIKFERVAFRGYFSTDLTLKAQTLIQKIQKKEIEDNGILHVSDLIGKAIELDRENVEAQTFQNEIEPEVQLEQRKIRVQNIVAENTNTIIEEVKIIEKPQNLSDNLVEKNQVIIDNEFINNSQDEKNKVENKSITNFTTQIPKQENKNISILQKEVKQEPVKQVFTLPIQNNAKTTTNYANTTPNQTQKIEPIIVKNYSVPVQETIKKQFQKLKIAIALDISGSMSDRYKNGTMQQVIEKGLALAIGLAMDETLEVWAFDTLPHPLKPIKQSDFSGYISREILSKYKINGGTETFRVLNAINHHFINQNTFVIIITDGEDNKENEMRQVIQQSLEKPIFWQFIGIGNNFSKLEVLSKINKNVSFFSLNDISTILDEDLYKKLLAEFLTWYKESEAKGVIR